MFGQKKAREGMQQAHVTEKKEFRGGAIVQILPNTPIFASEGEFQRVRKK